MRTILFLLILLLSSCLGVQMPGASRPDARPQPPDSASTARQEIEIDSAWLVGSAGQSALEVHGTVPDGCDFPVNADISFDGRLILVKLFRIVPTEHACPLIAHPFDETFPLPETIAPGPVTINVNGFVFDAVVAEYASPPVEIEPTLLVPHPIAPHPMPRPKDGNLIRVTPVIFDVDIMVLESYPMRLVMTVRGEFRNGCNLPIQTEQRRDGNTVTVALYRIMDERMMCPDVLSPFTHTIKLEGGFESGPYTIRVNDFTKTITL